MRDRGARYPVEKYPEIRELEAMLQGLHPGQAWDGVHFFASAEAAVGGEQPLFHFCRRTDRVLFTFSEPDWRCVNKLLGEVLSAPGLRLIMDRLSLEYGDV